MPQPPKAFPAPLVLFSQELKFMKGLSVMSKPDLSVAHARELVTEITKGDDGVHAEELLELIIGVADPDNIVAIEIEKQLYSLTPDFQSHFDAYLTKVKVA